MPDTSTIVRPLTAAKWCTLAPAVTVSPTAIDFVLPSEIEEYANVVLEALASGLPVMAVLLDRLFRKPKTQLRRLSAT